MPQNNSEHSEPGQTGDKDEASNSFLLGHPGHGGFIEASNLCRYYLSGPEEVRALDEVNLSIKRGEFVAIVGSSGSGKSTLLNLLAGLDSPTSGTVRVDNLSLGEMTPRELSAFRAGRVGMVFQMFNLLPHLSAVENVELALYFTQTPRKERRSLAVQTLGEIGLADRLSHRPTDLSGGEQQRVALARALVKKPDILFADEPTGNLDRENAHQTASLLGSLHKSGQTVVMVTHDLDLARQFAQRVVRMVYGKIAESSEAS